MENQDYAVILTLIKQRNIKHKAIQEYLGISKTMLSRKLHGKSAINVDEAIRIHNTFFPDISVEELFKK